MQLYVQSPSSALYGCFALHCGFAPLNAQPAGKATPEASFGVALWSNLPLALPVTKLEVLLLFAARIAVLCRTVLCWRSCMLL